MVSQVECPCRKCREAPAHVEAARHQYLRALLGRLDEQQRRWAAAIEAHRHGHGGTRLVAEITGLDEKTIRRGRRELQAGLADGPGGRLRRSGGGRKSTEKKPKRRPARDGLGGRRSRRSPPTRQAMDPAEPAQVGGRASTTAGRRDRRSPPPVETDGWRSPKARLRVCPVIEDGAFAVLEARAHARGVHLVPPTNRTSSRAVGHAHAGLCRGACGDSPPRLGPPFTSLWRTSRSVIISATIHPTASTRSWPRTGIRSSPTSVLRIALGRSASALRPR